MGDFGTENENNWTFIWVRFVVLLLLCFACYNENGRQDRRDLFPLKRQSLKEILKRESRERERELLSHLRCSSATQPGEQWPDVGVSPVAPLITR